MKNGIVALEFVGCCLGVDRRSAVISTLCSEIASRRLGWESVVSLANEHLVTPALWVALRNSDNVNLLPADLREYLRELHRLNTKRNTRLREQAVEAIRGLNTAGSEPVLLKGAAHLFKNSFGDLGARVMVDLDILVPEHQLQTSWDVLLALGYRAKPSKLVDYTQHHHCIPLFRPGDYGTVELHRTANYSPHLMPADLVWANLEPCKADGLDMKILSPTFRMLHNILHCEVDDGNYSKGAISIRYLHETVTMSEDFGDAVNWSLIQGMMDKHGKGNALRAHLYLASRLFGFVRPDGVRRTPSCFFHYFRTRSRVRWQLVESLHQKIQGFSRYSMRERYVCEDTTMQVTRARLKHALYVASRKFSSLLSSVRRGSPTSRG